jgi:spore maturation protein CgeB
MTVLYIGHYDEGSTSGMRGGYLKKILQPQSFTVANIDIPLNATNRFFSSLGWRYKIGPFISNINNYILSVINNQWNYDLVWVDKGVFIKPSILKRLRAQSKKMIHFTPDPAFTYHRSSLFYKAIPFYDACITTKSFEENAYRQAGAKQLIITTQGFKPGLHKPYHSFEQKKGIVFIGHHEKNREEILTALLEKKYHITLAGIGWASFVKKNSSQYNFNYLGNGIFGTAYAEKISGALLSLGLLSKIIPELHTTRTFEIPACGTALFTECNAETEKIFAADEVFFFGSKNELLEKVDAAFSNRLMLQEVTEKGMKKVREGGYDYETILKNIIQQLNL